MVFAVVSKLKSRIVKLNWYLKYWCHISLFIGIQDNIDPKTMIIATILFFCGRASENVGKASKNLNQ